MGSIPADSAVLGGDAPVYHREWSEPAYYQEYKKFDIASVEEPADLKAVVQQMVATAKHCFKEIHLRAVRQYGTRNMSTNAPSDAGVVNVKCR